MHNAKSKKRKIHKDNEQAVDDLVVAIEARILGCDRKPLKFDETDSPIRIREAEEVE